MIRDIGNHRVRHGDIFDYGSLDDLMRGDKADVFYSDPPWGTGNIKYWNTLNKKQNGIEKDVSEFNYEKFIERILELAISHTKKTGWIVIEYGVRWMPELIGKAESMGMFYCGTATTLYRSGSKFLPVDVAFFRLDKKVRIKTKELDGIKDTGERDIYKAMEIIGAKSGDIVLDPCTGLGGTAQVAVKSGMIFRGNELNGYRLDTAIKKIRKYS